MSYQPNWQERVEEAKPYVGPAIALVIVLGVGGWVGWKLTRPKPATSEPLPSVATTPAIPAESSNRDGAVELLQTQYEIARSLAVAAAARGSWEEAMKAYGEARTALATINEQYPKSPRADPVGFERLEAEIATAGGSKLTAIVAARVREAEVAAVAGRLPDAATAFSRALDAQRELNEKFPGHPQAGVDKVEALLGKRDTALAAPLLMELTSLEQAIALHLGAGDVRAGGEKITAARELVERIDRTYPQGTALTPALRQKIEFLNQWRTLLAPLHAQLRAQLVPLPGSSSVRILKTEVSQELYTRLMNHNQSRNAGKDLPVDSVLWSEAREFCTRLGWLLGAVVRLPTEDEFRAAVIAGQGDMWSRDNSGSRPQAVATSKAASTGIYDLLGNAAEWLEAPADSSQAAVAGGSYLDDAAILQTMPVRLREKRERAREIGFRVVVERSAN